MSIIKFAVLSTKNWIAGADSDCRIDLLYKHILGCFLKVSSDRSVRWVGKWFQTEGAAWQNTVLTTFTSAGLSRGRSKCPWFGLKIDHLSDWDIQVFFRQDCIECKWKCICTTRLLSTSWVFWKSEGQSWKIFNAATGSQCSLVRTKVCDCFSLYRKPPVRARWGLAAASRDFWRMFHGKQSYSSLDGSRPSNWPPCKASRRYIHVYDVRLWRRNEPPYIHYSHDCWRRACHREICQSFCVQR